MINRKEFQKVKDLGLPTWMAFVNSVNPFVWFGGWIIIGVIIGLIIK